MARIRRVMTVCDLHDGDASGDRTLFVLAERTYVIDTCAEHKAELRAAVALLVRAVAAHRATVRKRQGTRNPADSAFPDAQADVRRVTKKVSYRLPHYGSPRLV